MTLVEELRAPSDGWTGEALCVSAEIAAKAADEIERLREVLFVARQWMPDRPMVQSAWDDVAAVNAALGWAEPSRDGVKPNPTN